MSIIKSFEDQVEKNPTAIATTYKSEVLTYLDLNAKANKLAHYLNEIGCAKNTVVAVCMERSPDLIIAMLAILKVGGLYLPLNEYQSLEDLHALLTDCKAKILISRSHLQDQLDFFQGVSIFLDRATEVNVKSDKNLGNEIDSDDVACVFYNKENSSLLGTLVLNEGVKNYANWLHELFAIESIHTEFSTQASHINSISVSLVPLMLGWHVSICPDEIKSDLDLYLQFLNQEQINYIQLETAYFYALLDEVTTEKFDLLNLKYIVLNDTKLLTGSCLNWLNLYPQQILLNMYGKPETTLAFACFKVSIENVSWLPSYIPLGIFGPNIKSKINSDGELDVGGACVAKGYLNHEGETKKKFYKDDVRWFRTGDICDYNKNGELIYIESKVTHVEPQILITKAPIILPKTDLEILVLSIWRKEFNIDNISMEDNFFELGGHSLNATRILTKLEKLTGKRIYLQDIYLAATPAELTKVINNAENIEDIKKEQIQTHKQIPLTDFQFMMWMANLYERKAKKLNVLTRKRYDGDIDVKAMEFACAKLLQKQQLLCYKFLTYKPVQEIDRLLTSPLEYRDLSKLPKQEQESALIASMDELVKFYPWISDKPNLIVRLFKLRENESELQLCMPHIIADDYSLELLYSDLSAFYNNYKNGAYEAGPIALAQFKDYVFYEFHHFNRNLQRDREFWETNLENSILFPFPEEYVLSEADADKSSYSTYLKLSDDTMQKVRKACFKHKINIVHALSAAMALALYQYLVHEYKEKDIYFNIVKSMRDDEIFDNVVGPLLKTDAFKVKINPNLNVIDMAHRVQNEMIHNAPYQNSSGMLKLASVNIRKWKQHTISSSIIEFSAKMYAKLFPKLHLHPSIINSYVRLGFFRNPNMFLLNINLWGNFVSGQNKNLFGHRQIDLPIYKFDLTNIRTVLDITFLRDDYDKTYLVLSGNLQPQFREKLAREVVEKLMKI